ncbi:MAG TPA: MFS transporter [Streptosporangiaceae bacterium]|nr:MFS transporter [Streptosporangiaceae bacterium]
MIAIASDFSGFLVGMAISGLGFGVYAAVDLALVVDVLPDKRDAAKDLGVFNIAGALPFSLAPAIAPAILVIGSGSYGVLYMVAGLCAVIVAASLLGGKISDRTGRRKIFVLAASVVYGLALFVIAIASDFSGFLVGMAISGLGFGVYAAVDLALVVDVLPDKRNAAKDLGVFNIAGALPFSLAPAIAPAILVIGGGSYGVLYMVAGLCAVIGAFAILPVRRVR